jgi:ATP-binding cassette, subfamily F, member 3
LLLGQTRVSSDLDSAETDQGSLAQKVLEYVTRSDSKREKALIRLQTLASVIESKDAAPSTISNVVRKLKLENAEADLKEAQLIHAQRSGARGARAREDLLVKEEAVEKAKQR